MNSSNTLNLNVSKCYNHSFTGYFVAETVTLFVLSLVALPANLIFIYLLYKSTLFHPNVLFCLKSFSFGNTVNVIYFIGHSFYNCLLIYRHDAFEITRFTCAMIHIPYWIATVGQSGTMCVIGLERLKATWYPKLDQNDLNRANWSVKFGTFFGHVAGVVTLAILFSGVYDVTTTMCYCHVIFVGNYKAFIILAVMYVPGQLTIVLILLLVYRGNLKGLEIFYIDKARLTLQQRFDMSENVKLTKMLLPAIICHSMIYSIIFSSIPIINYYVDEYTAMPFINMAATSFAISVADTLANPILCIKHSEHLNKLWMSMFVNYQDSTLKNVWSICCRRLLIQNSPSSSNSFVNHHVSPDQNIAIIDKFWAMPKSERGTTPCKVQAKSHKQIWK